MNASDLELICPKDRSPLVRDAEKLHCSACGSDYPVVRGIPVIIDDEKSVFSTANYLGVKIHDPTSYGKKKSGGLRALYRRMMTAIQDHNVNIACMSFWQAFEQMKAIPGPILVIGAGNKDYGSDRLVYSDVTFSPKTTVICDGHALPFPDNYFSSVITVSVLEHVADPWQCAQEIKRVTQLGGYIYSSIPFLQPVHMGAHDFTRFTFLGHRRLFNSYDDIASGPELGPANSVTFAMQHMLLCLSDRPTIRKIMRMLGILLGEIIKPIDYLFRTKAGAYDAAAATFFFGRKTDKTLTDKEILLLYRGAQKAKSPATFQ